MLFVQAIILFLLVSCNTPSASFSMGRGAMGSPSKKLVAPKVASADLRRRSLMTDRGMGSRSALLATATASLPAPAEQVKGGDSSITTSTFNLAKSVIGAGVLSLPSGVAFFADEPSALIPASIICAMFGLMAAFTFSSIGNVCREYKASTFEEAWAKSVSPKSAWVVSFSITALCLLASLAYSIIIGDSFTALANTFQLPAALCSRSNMILLLTSLVLLPLCSLRNLSSLAPFSLLGLGGTLYTAAFMLLRLKDGSYAPGGRFFSDIAFKPSFGVRGGYALNHLTLVLLSMLSTSYLAHYGAPQFYNQLHQPSMPRFNTVVRAAFGAAIAFFILMMSTGFLTFGGATQGFVLNNYASSDPLAALARLAIGIALVTGYPFTFSALREGVLDVLKAKGPQRDAALRPVTFGLLGLVTALALVLKDVGFVMSMSGATFGCGVLFIVPCIMNIQNLARLQAEGRPNRFHGLEKAANYLLVATGASMGALGVVVSMMKQLGKL